MLCKYFENVDEFPRGFFKNKKIIELGAGTGCVGLILSRLGINNNINCFIFHFINYNMIM